MIGLYIEVSSPVVKTSQYLFTIQKFSGYSHNIAAVGGFWDATLNISVGEGVAQDWYANGLGRQMHVKNQFGGTVWRGFVNKITIAVGSQNISRGPLIEVVNRASAAYTPRDFTVYPPVDGTSTVTLLADNALSQANYGIFEQSVAAGTTTELVAIAVRDLFIEQNRLPKTTGDFSISGVGQPMTITLELLGNIHWLEVYPYNNYVPAVITAYQKILAVLNANTTINPGVFSTDYQFITDNAYAVEQLEDKNRFAWDVINEVLSFGNGSNDVRRLFGMYENDQLYYSEIPSVISYEYKLSMQNQKVTDYNTNMIIFPWDIRPGKWIRTSDWMIGTIVDTTDLFGDARNKFIENVNFSAPYTVGITGSPFDKLSQMLSKITYTGGIY